MLSGSPVAASALTLLDGGAIDQTQAFTMLTGSRLGAAFVVLVVGVDLRRSGAPAERGRRAPISIGILSLLMTTVVYVPGRASSATCCSSGGAFDDFDIGTSPGAHLGHRHRSSAGPSTSSRTSLPGWMLFPVGLGVLLVGFQLFDKVLPAVGSEELEDRPEPGTTRKWPMFLLGCGVCLLTLSVSVALTVLVPLVAKGHLRRANTLPYIAGANITTLADTLVAAILLGNQDAVRVVVAVTVCVTVWTLFLLTFCYPLVRRSASASPAGPSSPRPGWPSSSPCCSASRWCSSPSEPRAQTGASGSSQLVGRLVQVLVPRPRGGWRACSSSPRSPQLAHRRHGVAVGEEAPSP